MRRGGLGGPQVTLVQDVWHIAREKYTEVAKTVAPWTGPSANIGISLPKYEMYYPGPEIMQL
jgi:hypothetical protein